MVADRGRKSRQLGAAAQAIFYVHIENPRRIGGYLLGAIIAERSTVADVVIDAECLTGKFTDELCEGCRRQIGFENDLDALPGQ